MENTINSTPEPKCEEPHDSSPNSTSLTSSSNPKNRNPDFLPITQKHFPYANIPTPPDIPLLSPSFAEFSWNQKSCRIHNQFLPHNPRTTSTRFFYLADHQDQYHEIDFLQLTKHLCHPPQSPLIQDIAHAFETEPHQHEPRHLPQLITLCAPNP